MMLRQMVGVEAGPIVELDDLQPLIVELRHRAPAAIEMVEHSEAQVVHCAAHVATPYLVPDLVPAPRRARKSVSERRNLIHSVQTIGRRQQWSGGNCR